MMVVEPNMAQPVEQDEESIDLFSSTDWTLQTPYLFFRMFVQSVGVEPQLIKVWSRFDQGAVEV